METKFKIGDRVFVAYSSYHGDYIQKNEKIIGIKDIADKPTEYYFCGYGAPQANCFSTLEEAIQYFSKQSKKNCKDTLKNLYKNIDSYNKHIKESESMIAKYEDMIKRNDFTGMITIE